METGIAGKVQYSAGTTNRIDRRKYEEENVSALETKASTRKVGSPQKLMIILQ